MENKTVLRPKRATSNSYPSFFAQGPGYYLTPRQLKLRKIANRIIGGILLILHAPLLLFGAILIYFMVGWPLIYKGKRMGLHKKSFNIYKFRTLPMNAQQIIGSELLGDNHQLTSPLARLVRDIRLDEMPQLFNIFNGDMDFIGPRPVRPEVYEKIVKEMGSQQYDARFDVMPGLVGYAQLFTPHSTPKRIRAYIDNRFAKRPQSTRYKWAIVFFTACIFFKKIIYAFTWDALIQKVRIMTVDRNHRRRRLHAKAVKIRLLLPDKSWGKVIGLQELTSNALLVANTPETEAATRQETIEAKLIITDSIRGRTRQKVARCTLTIAQVLEDEDTDTISYLFDYKPVSPLNIYLVDQYFLKKSYA